MTNYTSGAYDPKSNITSASIQSDDEAPDGLQQICVALEQKALNAMAWYESRQQLKKRGARITRSWAILLGAITTIVPSMIAFLPEKIYIAGFGLSSIKLNPIATVIGVVAATMILLDKFYGFSSGWMRYVTTYQEIQSSLDEFRVNWRKQIHRLNSNKPPTDEQILAVYDFLAAFLKSINDSIRNETQAWVTEFKGVLSDIDKTIEAQKSAAMAKTTPSGGINILLQEYDTLDDLRWTVQLDNRSPETKEGQSSAAIPQLEPGLYRLRVAGQRMGKPVAAEYAVMVKSGEICEQKIAKLG